MRIALIGLGAIGQALLGCLAGQAADVRVAGALVRRPERHGDSPCPVFTRLGDLLDARPDLVIECASQRALHEHGTAVLASGAELLIASCGALADAQLLARLRDACERGSARIHIPAGALAGIDALAAARHVGLERVCYLRRAPPATWVRSGAIAQSRADAIDVATTVYAGNAREAALRFPKNANVTATIALAGIGFERTGVELVADPAATGNCHVIDAAGEFGHLHCEMVAHPISATVSSSRIVAGSLARCALARIDRITV